MNIYDDYNNIGEIKEFLSQLQAREWKPGEISPEDIRNFIDRHIKIIANQNDKTLQDQLLELSDRIDNKWKDNREAQCLAFDIMGIAKGVFKETKEELPELPSEAWGKILSFLPPRGEHVARQVGGVPSELEDFLPSTALSEVGRRVEKEWAGEELVSLKKYGCETAKDAVEYVIQNKLIGANLSEFPDLEDGDLEKLFKECGTLRHLSIQSYKITKLPGDAIVLQTLLCHLCTALENLPELPKVQKLHCSACSALQNLPELPSLKELDCSHCGNLQNLPELLMVKTLICNDCVGLQKLPDVPNLYELDCSGCSLLQKLPELRNVRTLDCSRTKLQDLSDLPLIEVLRCALCPNLQKLPEVSNLKLLICYDCPLQDLPELPQVEKVYCSLCPLLSLPAMPKVRELQCSSCTALQNISSMPNAERVNCNNCPLLQNLPDLPNLIELNCYDCPLLNLPQVPEDASVNR